jgi:hypothetical protein
VNIDQEGSHSIATGLLNDFQSQFVFGLKDPFACTSPEKTDT